MSRVVQGDDAASRMVMKVLADDSTGLPV